MSDPRDRIEHVVVVMFENRSFDHMLGDLGIEGVDRPGPDHANPLDPAVPGSPAYDPEWITGDGDVAVDPGHGYLDVMRQLTGGEGLSLPDGGRTNHGFVWNYASRLRAKESSISAASEIMRCSRAERVPVLSTLAREFAVCTRWFCSLPSETWPNRLFAHAAQSDGLVSNDPRPYGIPSVFDRLRDARVSWAIYAGDIPQAAAFMRPKDAFRDRFGRLGEFFRDVERSKLPQYSFVEPSHFGGGANSQHPTQRVWRGEELLKRIYQALAANREIWDKLLLVVTYDEHGGFFDHVRPPRAVAPFDGLRDAEHGFGFDLLGPRVPAVVAGPYVRKGADAKVRDHASIVRTVRDAFAVGEPLTARDRDAAGLLDLLGDQRRDPPPLPDVAREGGPEGVEGPEVARWAEGVRPDGTIRLNEFQEGLLVLKRRLDQELGGVESTSPPPEGFRSEEHLEAAIEEFRVRHMSG